LKASNNSFQNSKTELAHQRQISQITTGMEEDESASRMFFDMLEVWTSALHTGHVRSRSNHS